MKITPHTPRDFADAMTGLLPPGAAWEWPAGGLGDRLMLGMGTELARVDGAAQGVLDHAVETHQPAAVNWNITSYRRVAAEALAGIRETLPRRTLAVGSRVGDRCWSHAAPTLTFPVELVRIDHLLRPLRVGSRVGDRLWSEASRYVIRVAYYRSVVNPDVLFAALNAFKQAHVFLKFVDITGAGGEVNYGQD